MALLEQRFGPFQPQPVRDSVKTSTKQLLGGWSGEKGTDAFVPVPAKATRGTTFKYVVRKDITAAIRGSCSGIQIKPEL